MNNAYVPLNQRWSKEQEKKTT